MAIFDITGQQGTDSDKPVRSLIAVITDTATLTEAESLADGYFASTLSGGYSRTQVVTRELGWHIWEAAAEYAVLITGGAEPVDPGSGLGEFSISLDFSAATQHITAALQHVQSYGADGAAPDHGGAIGVNGDSVDGCDIMVPQATWQEQYSFAVSSISNQYLLAVHDLVGTTNAYQFRTRPVGSVLFTGASGQYSSSKADTFDMTFRFAYSKNVTDQQIGDIMFIDKNGWEYLWVEYAKGVSDDGMKRIAKPIAVHIERVYESASFATLGIGS